MKDFVDILLELEEGTSPVRKRRDKQLKRKRHITYLKNKNKKKILSKKRRVTSKFKKWQRKTKAKAKMGRTATGKRKSRFVN